MCLIVFALNSHPEYPLLVAANRDEHYARPTDPAARWPEHPELLAGRDLRGGGTWLGVTSGGRFAAITNHRNPPHTPANPRSRGLLTLDYLRGGLCAADYLDQLQAQATQYAGYNLLLGEGDEFFYYSNIAGQPQPLGPGIYGLSNALLDTPWPKLELGKDRLQQLLSGDIDHSGLQETVSDRRAPADHELPNTGVGLATERLLAPQFIRSETYGTRATTSLFRRRDGTLHFSETSFDSSGSTCDAMELTLSSDDAV